MGRYMRAPNRVKAWGMYSIVNLLMVLVFAGVALSALIVYFVREEVQDEQFSFNYHFNGRWLITLTFIFSLITAIAHFFETGLDCVTNLDATSRRFREYSVTATIMAYTLLNLNSYVLTGSTADFAWCCSLVLNSVVWLFSIYRIVTRNLQYQNGTSEPLKLFEDGKEDNNWTRSVLDSNDYFGFTYTTVAEILILVLGNIFGGFQHKHRTLSTALLIPASNYIGYWAETCLDFDEQQLDRTSKKQVTQYSKYYIRTILAWLLYLPFFLTFIAAIVSFNSDYPEAPDFVQPLLILEIVLFTLFGVIHALKPMFAYGTRRVLMIFPPGFDSYNNSEVILSFLCKGFLVLLTYLVVFTGMGVPEDTIITSSPIISPTTGLPLTTVGTTLAPVTTTMAPVTTPAPTQRELWESELAGRRALLSGECTYQEYITGMDCTNKAIMLHNHDFYDGTLTLDNGGYFKLAENIVFDPNADGDSFPACFGPEPNPLYCAGENANRFRLGWFAAISMRGDSVTLDLNYKTIQQGPSHYLRQRFYANIELADRPFLENQGPVSAVETDEFFAGGFGNLNFCTNCAIVDGFLSRASHHGIHGNLAINAYVANLQIDEYEGACISINSLRDSVFYNIDCSGSFEQIQVQAQFSQSIFMLQLADGLLMGMPTDDVGYADLLAKRDALRELVQVAEEYYIRGNANSDASLQQEMIDLFDMPATVDGRRVIGGNQYGIIINSKGVAVHQFVNEPKGWNVNNHFEHLQINKVLGLVREVPSIREGGAGRSVDIAGGTWRIADTLDQSTGLYVGDRLHDLRAVIGYYIYEQNGNSTHLRSIFEDPVGRARFGTWGIKPKLAKWAWEGTQDIQELFDDGSFQYICNEDAMAHIQKGNHGLILQDFADSLIHDVKIYEVINYGLGSHPLCGEYGRIYPSNQGPDHNGYSGCETRGLSLVASTNNDIVDVHINDVESHHCDAWGVQIWNGSSKNRFKNLVIDQVRTLADAKDEADFSSVDGIDFTIMNDM